MEAEHPEEEELLDGEESFVMPELEYTPVVTNNRRRAMESLKNIVSTSGLRHDIKRVHNTDSLKGATKWAKKHTTSKRQYTAAGEDIDGDGIQDVLVRDTDGNLVIVNGYTVRKSDYPHRQMFASLPKSARKEFGDYRNYFKTLYGPIYDPMTGAITGWKNDPKKNPFYNRVEGSGFRAYAPKNMSTYQLFCKEVSGSVIRELLGAEPELYSYEALDRNGEIVKKIPPVAIEVNADAWNYGVIKPILELMMKRHIPDDIEVDALKTLCARPDIVKFKKSREFKDRSTVLVRQYVAMDKEVTPLIDRLVNRIHITLDEAATKWIRENVKPLKVRPVE